MLFLDMCWYQCSEGERVGGWVRDKADNLEDLKKIREENAQLQEQISELTLENNSLLQDRYELEELRSLYKLDNDYSDLNKIAANVIGKDSGNCSICLLSTRVPMMEFRWI